MVLASPPEIVDVAVAMFARGSELPLLVSLLAALR